MTTEFAEHDDRGWGLPLLAEAICLSEEEMARASALVDPTDEAEVAWTRYLRALALAALRRELKRRDAAITAGPELYPEDPERLLALNGRATQLLCISPLAETVEVPLSPWRERAKAPQLLLLAQVDEDQGTVQFLGVLDAVAFVDMIQRQGTDAEGIVELPLEDFGGGLERLLRWVTLLEPDALPRAALGGMANAQPGGRAVMERLQHWLAQVLCSPALVPLPVLGTRGGETAVVRLITPEVMTTADGSPIAEALCRTPSIWADTPLAEILIERNGKVVWQQLATRRNPIEGPIGWPLEPLLPQQQLTIRLRPFGAAGGDYARLTLIAPDATGMEKGEEAVQHGLQELLTTSWGSLEESRQQDRALVAEIRARQWIGAEDDEAEVSADG